MTKKNLKIGVAESQIVPQNGTSSLGEAAMMFRYELEPRETIEGKLKRTQEELGRHSKLARARTIKAIVLSLVFGMALGAFGMVYFQTPKPQPITNDQRVKELRFSLQKLERLKDVHDATLREAATNQGEIRQMVKALGVGK